MSDRAARFVALPTAPPELPIADCSPATPDTGSGPYHSDDGRPTTPDRRYSDPATTTRRNCCTGHDRPPPADTSKVDTHPKCARAAFESPPYQAHTPCADKNGSRELSPAALPRDKNHPVAPPAFANPCIL